MAQRIKIAIVGATGYTGAELVRWLATHPHAELVSLVGHGKAGQRVDAVLPSLAGLLPSSLTSAEIEAFDADAVAARAQAVFCGLPHGASAKIVGELRARGLVVFDLSADFRLRSDATHEAWYGARHSPELASTAVYGLPELYREALRQTDLIAVPGCLPTAAILPLAPLFRAGFVADGPLIVDAKTGVSGAGRGLSERTHFSETNEGVRAYKIAGEHRHTCEIEQELSLAAGREVAVCFTPHLVPMSRGILSTSYVRLRSGVELGRCIDEARKLYEGSPSVYVHPEPKVCPDTLWVRGSNRALLSYALDERTGFVIAQGAIDNLGKGASSQAVQCFNVRFGFSEAAGLGSPATWP